MSEKVTWTPQQSAAIESRASDILVSAGAGSGKTTVLIERLIRKITSNESPLSVNRLLLVTFTNEAAGQLKQKIREAIAAAMAADPSNRHLNNQYLLLPQATVTTIHGFCLELVKKYHAKLGLPPKIKPSDDVQSKLLKRQVADAVVDGYYSSLPGYDDIEDFVSFADNFITLQDSSFTETVISIYDKLSEYPEGIDFLLKSINEYSRAESGLEGTLWAEMLLKVMKREYTYYQRVMEDACEAFDDGGIFAEKWLEYYIKQKKACSSILTCIENKDLNGLKVSLDLTDYNGHTDKKVTDKSLIDDRVQFYKDIRKTIRDESAKYKKQFFASNEETVRYTAELSGKAVSDLHCFLTAFEKRYSYEKKIRGIVDFSDIIRLAYGLLIGNDGKPTAIADEVSSLYDEVCIDEYQDVNKIQDDIFTAISRGNNRYMVGDIKQSIYGFRGSMPEIFAEYRRSDKVSNIDLNANFRCDKPIIDFSNDVCSVLFKNLGHTFEYHYEDDLSCQKNGGDNHPVEVVCISDADYKKSDLSDNVENNATPEIKYVARRIKNEIEKGTRPCDIAVLALTKTSFPALTNELDALGIKAKDADPPDLLKCPEVIVLLCILQAIDNPSKDIQLVGALKSPVFNFSVSDLALVKSTCPEHTFYHSLVRFTEENDFPKGRRFLEKLNEYRSMLNEPVDKLIWHVMYDSGLMYLSSREGGKDAEDRLLAFYDIGRTFESGTFKGLYNFLRSINEIIESEGTLAAPSKKDGDDVVRIMSIHKSKGLEFDTVFLINTGKHFVKKEITKNFLLNGKSGVSLKLTDSTGLVSYTPIYKKIANCGYILERDDENIRCLYVALTRAKRKLITVGTVLSEKSIQTLMLERKYSSYGYTFSRHDNFLGWIIIANKKVKPQIINALDLFESFENGDTDSTDSIVEEKTADESDLELLTKMYKERFEYTYPADSAKSIPAKLSVSKLYPAVLDEYDDSADASSVTNAKLKEPEFVSKKSRSGADVGTATHQFMQFCSLEALKNGIDDEIIRLTDKGFIDPVTASLVSVKDVIAFTETALFNELLSAKELRRELRFNVKLKASAFTEDQDNTMALEGENVLVQGIIDCLFSNPDGTFTVLDYKTDRTDGFKDRESAANMLIDRHKQQLSYYKKAAEIITGKKVSRVLLYSFSLAQAIEIPESQLIPL